MNNNKIALSSLALDLRRVAQCYFRGSEKTAERFFEEDIKRKNEIDPSLLKPYLKKILDKIEDLKLEDDRIQRGEDALMYSVIFQNASYEV